MPYIAGIVFLQDTLFLEGVYKCIVFKDSILVSRMGIIVFYKQMKLMKYFVNRCSCCITKLVVFQLFFIIWGGAN